MTIVIRAFNGRGKPYVTRVFMKLVFCVSCLQKLKKLLKLLFAATLTGNNIQVHNDMYT